MSGPIALCAADVPVGGVRRVLHEGFVPVAVFNLDGEYFAIDDTCTHGMASLSQGRIDGGVIRCPWHGGAFDIRTGQPANPPCKVPLRTYQVELRDGKLFATPALAPPRIERKGRPA